MNRGLTSVPIRRYIGDTMKAAPGLHLSATVYRNIPGELSN